jgi:hypothetical protein
VLGVLVLFCNREHNARKAIIFRKPVRTGTRALVLDSQSCSVICLCLSVVSSVARLASSSQRCRRCTSASTGGKKMRVELGLSEVHWAWLGKVQVNSPSTASTSQPAHT